MKRREMVMLVSGLMIGALLGGLIMGTSDSLRKTVFSGSSADAPDTDGQGALSDVEFYLADMESTREWLVAQSPDDSERIQTALEVLVSLPSSPDFRQDFQAAREDLDLVLPQLYNDLSAPLAAADDTTKAKLSACLGMNDDPYSAAPTLYFYLTVPKLDTPGVEVPSQWRKLDQPQSNTLFWQLLDCYPSSENPAS